jgi:hypothetical protein
MPCNFTSKGREIAFFRGKLLKTEVFRSSLILFLAEIRIFSLLLVARIFSDFGFNRLISALAVILMTGRPMILNMFGAGGFSRYARHLEMIRMIGLHRMKWIA